MMTNSNNVKALKSGIWYTAANFFVRSIGIITTPIFTRLLTHEEFGLYSNYTSWLAILTIVVTLNLDSTFISARFDFEDDFDRYILSVLSLSSISAFFSACILNVFFYFFQESFGMSRFYLNSMMIYLLFLPAVNMFQARERYFFKYKVSVALSLTISICTALLSVVLVVVSNDKLYGRVIGSIAPTIAVGAVLYYYIYQNGKSVNRKYWGYALPICMPYIPHMLSLMVLNMVDRIMITRICGAADNALYSLAYTCGTLITIFLVSMNSAFAPWLGQKMHEGDLNEIRGFAKKYIALFVIIAVGVMLFSPEILLVLGGKSYMGALYVMPPVACGCIFQFLYTMFVNVEQFSKKTTGMAIASFSAALINYILNIICIPRFGFLAAAYTTLAGYIWLLIAHMYLVKKYGWSKVYSYRFVVLIAVLSIVIMIFINFLYSITLLRVSIGIIYIITVCCVLYKNREIIIQFVRK